MAEQFPGITPEKPQKGDKANRENQESKKSNVNHWRPFKILGMSDNNSCFFIGRNDRLIETTLGLINKSLLLQLAPLDYWYDAYSSKKQKINWDNPIDDIIERTSEIDFDPEIIRGRGAWIDDGNICYHDGKLTTGEPSKDKIYLRKPEKNIGIASQLPLNGTARRMYYAIDKMSFESGIDAVRLISWSLLAPFAGALPWRPAILLTGASGSGKSTAIDKIVKPLARPEIFSGGVTTEAGVRQRIKNDAAAIVIEESETDTKKKKNYRADLFSLMRQSTSNDAPRAAKGTKDGRGQSFKLRSMFMFAAISPEIESEADDNRIFLVNMQKTDGKGWREIEKEIDKYVTPSNCASFRAMVWANLEKIIRDCKKLAVIIQDITKRDMRSSVADGLLFSTFFNVVLCEKNQTEAKMRKTLEMFFAQDNREPQRNETDEMIDRLLDERVQVELRESVYGGTKTKRYHTSLRQILISAYIPDSREICDFEVTIEERRYLRSIANAYGLAMDKERNLLIVSGHHEIQKILGVGRGFQRQLYRHKGIVQRTRVASVGGKSRRCVVIGGLFDDDNEQKELKV